MSHFRKTNKFCPILNLCKILLKRLIKKIVIFPQKKDAQMFHVKQLNPTFETLKASKKILPQPNFPIVNCGKLV